MIRKGQRLRQMKKVAQALRAGVAGLKLYGLNPGRFLQ
jgi:hypothetical protein